MLNMMPAVILDPPPPAPRGHSVSPSASPRANMPSSPLREKSGRDNEDGKTWAFPTIKEDALISHRCLFHWLWSDVGKSFLTSNHHSAEASTHLLS